MSAIGALLLPPSALELAASPWPITSADGWLGVVYLAVFASAGAYALYDFALRELDASTVGALTNIDPIVGLVTAFVVLGETLLPVQAVGAAVVIVGMSLASTERGCKRAEPRSHIPPALCRTLWDTTQIREPSMARVAPPGLAQSIAKQ